MTGTIDTGVEFGLRQQPWGTDGTSHTTGDPLVCSGGSVSFNITQFQDKFPNYYQSLLFLGWSNADMLARTYPTAALNEAHWRAAGGWGNDGKQNRNRVYVPSGVWHINSEIRGGQCYMEGDGAAYNFGQGGTQLREYLTSWKSIHGAQNNAVRILFHPWVYGGEAGTTPSPIAIAPNSEWCHDHGMRYIRCLGAAGDVYDPAVTHIAHMYYAPGEASGPDQCRFDKFDVPVLISHRPAEARVRNCSMFQNNIACVGIRGGAHSDITLEGICGDINPYLIFGFRQGTNAVGTGPFLPHNINENPGGNIKLFSCKIEAYACAPGSFFTPSSGPAFSACDGLAASVPGKGMMLARLTGRFAFTAYSPTLNVHNGMVDSMIEVVDDYFAFNNTNGYLGLQNGNIPLSNSSILILQANAYGFENWVHEFHAQRKHRLQVNPVTPANVDISPVNYFWQNNQNLGQSHDPMIKGQPLHMLIPASYRGRQPFINTARIGIDVWNHNAAPTFGYDVITGTPY